MQQFFSFAPTRSFFSLCLFSMLLLAGFSMNSCSDSIQTPEFREIRNIKIIQMNTRTVKIKADANIHNPNMVGLNISTTDIDVILEGKHKAKVQKMENISVPANADFNLPIVFEFSPRDIFKEDILGSALSILGRRKVDALFKGTLHVNVGDITKIPVPIEEHVEIPLKK